LKYCAAYAKQFGFSPHSDFVKQKTY